MSSLWRQRFAIGLAMGLSAALVAAPGSAQTSSEKTDKAAEGKHEPSTLAVSIPWQWLASSGGTMTFQCEADKPASDDGVRMIEALRRDAHGRYTGKGGDGGTFHGTRKGEDFTFEAVGKDGSKFVMQMPWSAARCIFGGAKLAEASSVSLRAKDVGGRLRVEVAGETKGVSVEVRK
jgi:hypothetical protein